MKFDFANFIVNIASVFFPAVEKMKGGYELSQVAILYYSVIWLMSPLLIIGGFFYLQNNADNIISKCRSRKFLCAFVYCCIGPILSIFMFLTCFESTDIDNFRTVLAFHSRIGMATYGFIFPAAAAVGISMLFFWLKNFSNIYVNQGKL